MHKYLLMLILMLVSDLVFSDSPTVKIDERDYLSSVGNCACPYNKDNVGNLCGKRSAWCRAGRNAPVCDSNKIGDHLKIECNQIETSSSSLYGVQVSVIANAHTSESDYLDQVGNCPCPYNVDREGVLCGKRSAWCKPGGYSPVCKLTMISQDLIDDCNIINY